MTRICLIGFGEVGQILAEDLAAGGAAELSAYDLLFADPESPPSRALPRHAIRDCGAAADAVAGAALVISAVTAAQDVEAARSVAGAIVEGGFFLDLNSASPGMKQASAAIIERAGGRYVEAAVMAPFPPKRLGSPMLLGGPHAQAFADLAQPLGFSGLEVFSDQVGQASATKMCRSVMIKGIEALLTESMLAARHYGVEATVLASLSDLLPLPDWEATARYMISRSLEHGVRRAEEMREAARTVEEAGVAPTMSAAIAQRQDWAADYRGALAETDLGAMLDHIIRKTA
ncbi:DUF1932 domain-containing protein [Phenylobacterium sp.]|uniref:NAD(P)-dependent oxidoreductase n=1 Tax=Phenylobacterium sp. TaxID=1871053 RepID=UPI003BA931CE